MTWQLAADAGINAAADHIVVIIAVIQRTLMRVIIPADVDALRHDDVSLSSTAIW